MWKCVDPRDAPFSVSERTWVRALPHMNESTLPGRPRSGLPAARSEATAATKNTSWGVRRVHDGSRTCASHVCTGHTGTLYIRSIKLPAFNPFAEGCSAGVTALHAFGAGTNLRTRGPGPGSRTPHRLPRSGLPASTDATRARTKRSGMHSMIGPTAASRHCQQPTPCWFCVITG